MKYIIKIKNIITSIILLVFILTSCKSINEIAPIITKEYVINPNWNKNDNTLIVTKMVLKDSLDIIYLDKIDPSFLINKLVCDDFSFITNVNYNGEDYFTRKVYFNKNNGFFWNKTNDIHSDYKQKILGSLKQNTWYKFEGLSNIKTLYYIYIDNDSLYSYKVTSSYWTNY